MVLVLQRFSQIGRAPTLQRRTARRVRSAIHKLACAHSQSHRGV
jgi:hypothetical protein